MRFIFVRHGKTHFNEINLTQGWCDSPLSKVGITQVENISKQLEQYQIDKAYTSPSVSYTHLDVYKRQYLTINQNDVKIIATVSSEKVIDQQNSVKSEEFDNRFHKNSVNRVIELKTKGIIENNEFKITSKYVPMIGNEVALTTKDELNIIYGLKENDETIIIGKTILEGYPCLLYTSRCV